MGPQEETETLPLSPDGHIENINLDDTFNFYMIQGLRLGSEYTVTINPIFGDTEGPVTAVKIQTCNWDPLLVAVTGQL